MSDTQSFSAKFFNKLGYVYMRNVLTPEQCQQFTDLLFAMKNDNTLQYEGTNTTHYRESYGGNCPEFEQALRDVTPRVQEELQLKITPANTYGRIYFNGGRLAKHVDRAGLDYTLSISLKSTISSDWPLYGIDTAGTTVPLHITEGDGGMMLGTKIEHWRDDLTCKPDEWVAKLFMHWSIAE